MRRKATEKVMKDGRLMVSHKNLLRIISDIPREGTENMAINEVMLQEVEIENDISSMRFYHWIVLTLSL
jgi:lipoate-protein ligase A